MTKPYFCAQYAVLGQQGVIQGDEATYQEKQMRKRLTRLFVLTLTLCLAAGQAAAFDLHIGRLDFGPSPADTFGPRRVSDAAVGAMFTIPFGDSGSRKSPPATVNGMDMTRFTQQNAKDSFIVVFLVGTLVAVGVLSATLVSNSVSSD